MVDLEQEIGFDELGFNCLRAYRDKRFAGEDNGAFRNRPKISAEPEIPQIIQKSFGKTLLFTQIGNVVVVKVQIADVLDNLFQSRGNGISAVVGILAVENVEINVTVGFPALEITVAHSQFVKVKQHRQITADVFHRFSFSGGRFFPGRLVFDREVRYNK